MSLAHLLKLLKVRNDGLQLGMVEPAHLNDLGQQNDNHVEHLLLAGRPLIDQEVQEVILDSYFFLHWNFLPVHSEQLLQ